MDRKKTTNKQILVRYYISWLLPTDSLRTLVRPGASDGPASLFNGTSLLLRTRMGHLVRYASLWDIGSVLSQLAPPDGHLSGPEPRAGPPHLRYSPQWHILGHYRLPRSRAFLCKSRRRARSPGSPYRTSHKALCVISDFACTFVADILFHSANCRR